MGQRYGRAALLIEDGRVRSVFAEDQSGQVTGSGAPAILMALEHEAV